MLRDDVAPASRDFRDGLVPGNTFKCPAAFGANAPHGIEQSLRMIDAIKVAIDLGTEPTSRYRVIGAPTHADGPPLLIHPRLQRTTVGAVVRAGAIYYAQVMRLFNLWRW